MSIYADPSCHLIPKLLGADRGNRCDLAICAKPLPAGRRRWCSDRCAREQWAWICRHHEWSSARAAALERDEYTCRSCGWSSTDPRAPRHAGLEVNHIIPRNGAGYGPGCWHHQRNLEVLCRPCHVKVTKLQREMRRAIAA